MPCTLGELARVCGAELSGDPALVLDGVAPLERAGPSELSFLASARLRKALRLTRAGAVILSPRDAPRFAGAKLITDNPYAAYARAVGRLSPLPAPRPGVDPCAFVHADARVHDSARVEAFAVVQAGASVGPQAWVGPGCVVDAGVTLGAGSRLVAHVTLLSGTTVGARCLLHPGVVVGSDGFGHAREQGRWIKVPQLGGARIGDDVEIGANTTVDRGALDDTVIGDGVRLDNQIQVAHGVCIGPHTVIAACVGISGSTRIGARCAVGGGVGFVGHLEICDDVVITGMSMVARSITQPGIYSGNPAQPNGVWRRNMARLGRLDELARQVARLHKRREG